MTTQNELTKNSSKQEMPPVLQINSQYIKDLSFEAPAMPFLDMREPPKVDISININAAPADKEKKLYTVDLVLKIEAKTNEKTAFICELTYGALATVNVPEEHIRPLLLIEVPHLLFPYVRAIVANTTREAGIVPLTLAPIDFAALYRTRLEQEAKEQKVN